MSETNRELFYHAKTYRDLYNSGQISRAEAKNHIQPYVDLYNETSTKLAKKYNQRAKLINFAQFVR